MYLFRSSSGYTNNIYHKKYYSDQTNLNKTKNHSKIIKGPISWKLYCS